MKDRPGLIENGQYMDKTNRSSKIDQDSKDKNEPKIDDKSQKTEDELPQEQVKRKADKLKRWSF